MARRATPNQPDGSTVILIPLDRFNCNVYQVGDLLYMAQTIGKDWSGNNSNVRDAIQVVVMHESTNVVIATYTIGDSSHDFFLPSIAANAFGQVVVGYNRSSESPGDYIGSFASVGTLSGSNLSFDTTLLLKAGEDNYHYLGGSNERWGDYSATRVDPSNPHVFWTFQEFAQLNNSYGTQVTSITVNERPVQGGTETTPLAYAPNSAAQPVTSSLQLADTDDAILTGATIRIATQFHQGQDRLAFANTSTIRGAWDATTGTLTLSGADAVANYQSALRSVTYQSSSTDSTARTVTMQVTDGIDTSNLAQRRIGASVVVTGTTLDVYGVDGADTITVTYGSNLVVTLNGVEYSYATNDVAMINVHGNGGNDTLTFTGTSGDEAATLRPGTLDVTGLGYALHADGVESVRANGGGGTNDRATLYDSVGNDSLIATPNYARLSGAGYLSYATDFDKIYAYATAGDAGGVGDQANLFDSAGNDALFATPTYAQMTGAGYLNYAANFDKTFAYATAGDAGGVGDRASLFDSAGNDTLTLTPVFSQLKGTAFNNYVQSFDQVSAYATAGDAGGVGDVANLYDSAGNDTLTATPVFSQLKGTGFSNYAQSFDKVYASATAGDTGGVGDVASLYDSTGNDTLLATPTYGQLTGPGYFNYASKFDRVNAYASTNAGGVGDVSNLYDSTGNDTLTAAPTYSQLTGPGYFNYASKFGRVNAYASTDAGGAGDQANLYDSVGNDVLIAAPTSSQMTGPSYFNYASKFDKVYAYASTDAGGAGDQATLYDSAGNDTFTGTTLFGLLTGTGFYNYVQSFDKVFAYATAGGTTDVANLYDSAGNDTYTGTPLFGLLTGTGFYNYVRSFDRVYAYASTDAGGVGDQANLYDSAGTDTLYARSNYAYLQGATFYNYLRSFDHVKAYANAGGDDTFNASGLSYDLKRFGSWEHVL